MNSNSRLSNIEAIRCFAILSVVAWHCLCVYVGWKSFLPDITEAVGSNTITNIYRIAALKILMPNANMPLFVSVSAFVYSTLYKGGAYFDTLSFLKKKVKRLVIPYFVIGTIVVFTIADWKPISILFGDAHHLWFCAMLFWCFVLIRLYHILPTILKVFLVIVCVVTMFVSIPYEYNIFGIITGLKYFPYFIFGFYLVSFLPKYKQIKYNKLLAILLWLLTLVLTHMFSLNRIPTCITYCFLIFVLVPESIEIPKWVSTISSYSFGIYVFHEWFLWNAAHIPQLHPFIIEHQVLYPLIAFAVVFPLSYILTKYSLKTKVGRYLLA